MLDSTGCDSPHARETARANRLLAGVVTMRMLVAVMVVMMFRSRERGAGHGRNRHQAQQQREKLRTPGSHCDSPAHAKRKGAPDRVHSSTGRYSRGCVAATRCSIRTPRRDTRDDQSGDNFANVSSGTRPGFPRIRRRCRRSCRAAAATRFCENAASGPCATRRDSLPFRERCCRPRTPG
jgi:hypothetical protein